MLAYSVKIATRSLMRNKMISALMVVALAIGIGAAMTTLTLSRALSGDPLPGRSDGIFRVQLDAEPMRGHVAGGEPTKYLTRRDAEQLLAENRADEQAVMAAGVVGIEHPRIATGVAISAARYTSSGVFRMFAPPFLYGGGWGTAEDDARSRVTVISRKLNDRLFGGANSIGEILSLDGQSFRVIGVFDDWRPVPRFYDLSGDPFAEPEAVFMPYATAVDLELKPNGSTVCWGDVDALAGGAIAPNAPCAWLQYWVQLQPSQKRDYHLYLEKYSDQQRADGRFWRPANVRLRDVNEWIEFNKVVPNEVRMQTWIALGFLAVCLANSISLLLAKSLQQSGEVGLRRALGATRRQILMHSMVEVGMIGACGGLLGLLLTLIGLWVVRQQPDRYAQLAQLDAGMFAATFMLALAASAMVGLLPAWRAMQVEPALRIRAS
ncbi:FtsX-like permease family protein [Lysobacter maris]|uniref:FtsX-like permease family protein n=1 Tax=Marilutibacter maris TaxID=1605891 RepID=A0A508ACW9_9GAMM|nr:ABC transporter permease [Lysobacter maris]KAB8174006.1 FtsX-like permease family protein [Lysobacter maris]